MTLADLHPLYQAITEATCGEACWQAREDVCRCSCGGINHGVIPHDGQRPERTRKIARHLYQLVAVESPAASCRAMGMRPLEDAERQIRNAAVEAGMWRRYDYTSTPGYPAKIKTASESEVARWPELTAFKGMNGYRPTTLWVRCDMVHLIRNAGVLE